MANFKLTKAKQKTLNDARKICEEIIKNEPKELSERDMWIFDGAVVAAANLNRIIEEYNTKTQSASA